MTLLLKRTALSFTFLKSFPRLPSLQFSGENVDKQHPECCSDTDDGPLHWAVWVWLYKWPTPAFTFNNRRHLKSEQENEEDSDWMNQQLMSEEVPNSGNKKSEDERSGAWRASGLHLQGRRALWRTCQAWLGSGTWARQLELGVRGELKMHLCASERARLLQGSFPRFWRRSPEDRLCWRSRRGVSSLY